MKTVNDDDRHPKFRVGMVGWMVLVGVASYIGLWSWVLAHRVAHDWCGVFLWGCP